MGNHPLSSMEVKALKSFISTRYGSVEQGRVFECDEQLAAMWMQNGMVGPPTYDTKVIREVPTVAGEAEQSSSSPADPASPETTPRKRRAKRSSRSTTR